MASHVHEARSKNYTDGLSIQLNESCKPIIGVLLLFVRGSTDFHCQISNSLLDLLGTKY